MLFTWFLGCFEGRKIGIYLPNYPGPIPNLILDKQLRRAISYCGGFVEGIRGKYGIWANERGNNSKQ